MGMCKSCGIVFNANDMVNGYWEDCKPEFLQNIIIRIKK